MSKTLEVMQEYLDRKKDRRDDYAENMDKYIALGSYEEAEYHLKKSNELTLVMDTIEHCMSIVRATTHETQNHSS